MKFFRASSAPSQRRPFETRQAVTPAQAAQAFHKWLQEKDRQKRLNDKGAPSAGNRRQPDPQRREEALKVSSLLNTYQIYIFFDFSSITEQK